MGRDARGRNFGKLRLMQCMGFKLVVSPDIFMWLFPSAITIGLFVGGLYTAGKQPLLRWSTDAQIKAGEYDTRGYIDLFVTCCLVVLALFFSLIVGLTDPGAIPRVERELNAEQATTTGSSVVNMLSGGDSVNGGVGSGSHSGLNGAVSGGSPTSNGNGAAEHAPLVPPKFGVSIEERQLLIDWPDLGKQDPYEDQKGWTECRTCCIRRPPRTSHCYVCQICTLSADHHCGVVGGCVSLRSLRWFWAYLVCVSSAALNTMTWVMNGLFHKDNNKNPGSVALHITLLIFIGNIVLMVGGLACFYTYLVTVDMTRRESQGKAKTGKNAVLNAEFYHEHLTPQLLELQRRPFGHLYRVLFPPPSLVAWTASSSQKV